MHRVAVWDWFVRFSHWTVALLFLSNYFLTEEGETIHEWVGYSLAAIVVLRLLWGLLTSGNARLSGFFPAPKKLLGHLRQPLHVESLDAGHNPLGALMVFFLWLMLLLLAFSGWLQTTDRFWGEEWVEEMHEICANLTLFAVCIHVTAVIVMGRLTKQALIRPMITGYRESDKIE